MSLEVHADDNPRGIFICSGCEDAEDVITLLKNRLDRDVPDQSVFLSIDQSPAELGSHTREQIHETISSCGVLLLLIGPNFPIELSEPAKVEQKWLRLAIESALVLGKNTLLVRVNEANHPTQDELAQLGVLADSPIFVLSPCRRNVA